MLIDSTMRAVLADLHAAMELSTAAQFEAAQHAAEVARLRRELRTAEQRVRLIAAVAARDSEARHITVRKLLIAADQIKDAR